MGYNELERRKNKINNFIPNFAKILSFSVLFLYFYHYCNITIDPHNN